MQSFTPDGQILLKSETFAHHVPGLTRALTPLCRRYHNIHSHRRGGLERIRKRRVGGTFAAGASERDVSTTGADANPSRRYFEVDAGTQSGDAVFGERGGGRRDGKSSVFADGIVS